MDDDKQHAQELAKLGRAVREAREPRGLSERDAPPYRSSHISQHAIGVEPSAIVVRAESLSAE